MGEDSILARCDLTIRAAKPKPTRESKPEPQLRVDTGFGSALGFGAGCVFDATLVLRADTRIVSLLVVIRVTHTTPPQPQTDDSSLS